MSSWVDHNVAFSHLVLGSFGAIVADQASRVDSRLRKLPSISDNSHAPLYVTISVFVGIIGNMFINPLHASVDGVSSLDAGCQGANN